MSHDLKSVGGRSVPGRAAHTGQPHPVESTGLAAFINPDQNDQWQRLVFHEIAEYTSYALDAVAGLLHEAADERLIALECMLAKVGALADASLKVTGDEPFRGDAFAWLISPAARLPEAAAGARDGRDGGAA